MHRSTTAILVVLLLFSFLTTPAAEAAEHRFGLGAHFWKTVDDLVDDGLDDIEEDGFAYLVSYKYVPRGLFSLGVDLEVYDDFGLVDRESISPIFWVYVGKRIYGAAGYGVNITSSDLIHDETDDFWAARAGIEFQLLPRVTVDVNANYRAISFGELDQADTDAVTLGAILRWTF